MNIPVWGIFPSDDGREALWKKRNVVVAEKSSILAPIRKKVPL